jgi:hypothetical protein
MHRLRPGQHDGPCAPHLYVMQTLRLFSLYDLVLFSMEDADGPQYPRVDLKLCGCRNKECTFLCRCSYLFRAERERDRERADGASSAA